MTAPQPYLTADGDLLESIRDTVCTLCARFPDMYWRELDRQKAYPTDFARGRGEGR